MSRTLLQPCLAAVGALLAACGGSGSTDPPATSAQAASVPTASASSSASSSSAASTYTIGGTVSGLLGSGLVLSDNVGDRLNVSADGSFTFPTGYTSGQAYQVTVASQPSSPSQLCAVTVAGSGTLAAANVTDVAVDCRAPPAFQITEYSAPNVEAGLANVSDGSLWALTTQQSAGIWTNALEQIAPTGVVTALPIQGALAETSSALAPPLAGPNGLDLWLTSTSGSGNLSITTFSSIALSGAAAGTAPLSRGAAGALNLQLFDGCGNLWYASSWSPGGNSTIGSVPTGIASSGSSSCPAGAASATSVVLDGADIAASALGRDGRVWFTSRAANAIGVVTPAWLAAAPAGGAAPQSAIALYPLPFHADDVNPDGSASGSAPAGIALGSDGNMWFVERAQGEYPRIGCMPPDGSQVSEYPVTSASGYVLGPNIAVGPDGNMWFSVWPDEVGTISTSSVPSSCPAAPQISLSTVPAANAWPSALTAGPDGRMWFIEPANLAPEGQVGAVALTPAAPANDDFAAATVLGTPSGFTFTNDYAATAQPGEPDLLPGVAPKKTLWWRWTAPAAPSNAALVLSTYGSSYETVIGVYTGANLAALQSVTPTAGHQPGPGLTTLCAPVTSGTTYDIVVDGYNGASGVLLLDWRIESSCP